MLIRIPEASTAREHEVTPEPVWADRRRFLAQMGLTAVGLAVAGCGKADPDKAASASTGTPAPAALTPAKKTEMAGGEALSPWETVTTYNNYYEFGTAKDDPSRNAGTLRTRPWTLRVEGECEAPGVIGIDDLLKAYPLEERIYRHRCVEAWSIVVPWDGIPLAEVIKRFKPNSRAKFVAFETLYDPQQMPETRRGVLDWPYIEGLRIDEAMHPLTLLTVGLYGKVLPNQNGAPLRLTVPWKYGFKSIKSIVKMRFVETLPRTTWNAMAPNEYGFYSNVNPAVDHPRWSQASERRLGELFKRKTLPFNGYTEVASLYTGMDLRKNF